MDCKQLINYYHLLNSLFKFLSSIIGNLMHQIFRDSLLIEGKVHYEYNTKNLLSLAN